MTVQERITAAIAELKERHPTTEVAQVVLSGAEAEQLALEAGVAIQRIALGGAKLDVGGPTYSSSRYLLPGQAVFLDRWDQVVGVVGTGAWRPIETAPSGPRCLLTNNIKATDAHGEMSNVWIGFPIRSQVEPDRGFVTFDSADRKVLGITHWMPLPVASSEAPHAEEEL